MAARALQVYLNEPDFEALEAWARARGWTLSQAVRVALKALTAPEPPASEDPLLAASGMVEGLPADLSQRFDHYVGLTYVAAPPLRYEQTPRKRRSRKSVR